MSFKDAELDLNDMGNILVTGRNYCKLDNAYSNGSGKSSIFNAICFALTGETSQGVSNGIENIFSNPDDCWVKLTFEADGDLFEIKRVKTPKPDMKIWINGEDKSGKGIRESSKLLATYLPDLTSELISSVIILGQGLPYRFSNNNPAQRKELLEKLTKSDFMIQSIKDRLETRQATLRESLHNREMEKVASESQTEIYLKQLEKIEEELEEYDQLTSEMDFDARVEQIDSKLAELEEDIDDTNSRILEAQKIIGEHNQYKSEVVLKNQEELKVSLAQIEEEIEKNSTAYNDEKFAVDSLKKEIKTLDAITDICPTCGQKIPDVNKPDTTEKKATLKEMEKNLKVLKETLDESKKVKEEVSEKFANELVGLLASADESIKGLNKDIDDYKTRLLKQEKSKKDLQEERWNCINLKNNYDRLISDKTSSLEKVEELKAQTSVCEVDIVSIRSHLDIVQQMITLAKREFRGILLSNIIEFINKKVKQYSLSVFGTTELDFYLDENCIDITYYNNRYENLSGGEKQKIDIIIQLALRDILSKQLNIHTNLLICDEIYDNMDGISCQKITNLISTLTDISSIFIISHHAQDLEITYDSNLLVEKDESGISSISYV